MTTCEASWTSAWRAWPTDVRRRSLPHQRVHQCPRASAHGSSHGTPLCRQPPRSGSGQQHPCPSAQLLADGFTLLAHPRISLRSAVRHRQPPWRRRFARARWAGSTPMRLTCLTAITCGCTLCRAYRTNLVPRMMVLNASERCHLRLCLNTGSDYSFTFRRVSGGSSGS